ncbi:MAG: glycogen debranching N-terminal domain-containing protein, partial [Xanthobacteraceae bacterium]
MSFKVHVGPPQITIHQGQTVLVTEPDGQITWPSEKGLYFLDTRVISNWAIYANGEPWELLNGGPVNYDAARIFLTNKAIPTEDGTILPRTLGLTISRSIGGGLHEDLDITNNSMKPVRFQLEVAFRCDFADVFEVKSGHILRRGQITTEWSAGRQQVRTVYSNRDFHRAVTTSVARPSSKAVSANGRLSFDVALQPSEAWHVCLLYTLEDGAQKFHAPGDCLGEISKTHHSETMADWLKTVAKIETRNEEFYRLFHQALEDMAALRLPIKGTSTNHMVFIPAAGLPWFVAPFGRDSLLVSLQNVLIYPEFARGALEILGSLQAKEDDPYRDAEPGKILHELRYGELAHFKLIPHTPYYGTADAT